MRIHLLAGAAAAILGLAWAGGADVRGDERAAGNGDADRLVYADFQNSADGRPVSSRGGKVSLWGYQESPTRMSIFKGHEADNGIPKLVRTSKADDNHAAAFDYELVIPNQWAGVTMAIEGRPYADGGTLPPDDVSGFKTLSIQAYVTGTQYLRVEVLSHGSGINLHSGYPMTSFKLKDGFNTYKVRMSAFSQPSWVQDTRIDPKDVLKKLTSMNFTVFCDDCRPTGGTVVLDNIVFEK